MVSRTSPSAHVGKPTATELQSFLARVEAATGPDHILNGDLLRAFGWSTRGRDVLNPEGNVALLVPDPISSLDDALTLAERVLPGRTWSILNSAMRAVSDAHHRLVGDVSAQEITLAVLVALLKVLITQEEPSNG